MTESPRRPHVLWVNHFTIAPDMGGGTRQVEMGRELVRRGWRVTLAASDFHVFERRYTRRNGSRAAVHEQIDGVDIQWLWAAPYDANDLRRVGNWLSFAQAVRRHEFHERPDVVIGSTPQLFAALAAQRVARRLGVPFVLEVRDLWPETLAVGGVRRGPGYWGLWALARFLYRAADRIVVLARGVEDHLVSGGVPRERIIFVPNGVDAAAFDRPATPPRDTLRLVYAGAHGPANGLEAVLDAAARLREVPGVHFEFVGDGPARPVLIATARDRGLTNVSFRDAVPKRLMPDVLASCDAGLMVLKDVPLFSFGVSPNKLFDYWGAGLPVVCNVPGEVAGIVRDAGGGLQAADASGAALAAAVRSLLAMSPAERRALGECGRAWVRRERDRPVLAARLDGMLQNLVPVAA